MSCNSCRRSPCCCLPGVPQPFYAQTPVCAEDHTKNVYINQMSLGVQIQSDWNVPLCGASAILSVPGLVTASVGSSIWHDSFGYFEIIAYDAIGQTITVQNNCLDGNAAPGTQIPACTTFAISPPPCCQGTQDGVFVAIDFTAPDEGDCIDITLTSVEGLLAGYGVSIGSGIYDLTEIKANNVVTICNNGEGIVPGTPVIAQDFAGNYQYPVTIVSTNPCLQDATAYGTLLVCRDGLAKPMDVPAAPTLLVGSNAANNIVTFEYVGNGLEFNGNILQVADCLSQGSFFDIPYQLFTFSPTLSDTTRGISENDLGIIRSAGVPPTCQYDYEATVQFIVNTYLESVGGTGLDFTNTVHEVNLKFDEDSTPYGWKYAWTPVTSNLIANTVNIFPGEQAVQDQVPVISSGSDYVLTYSAFQIKCFITDVRAATNPSVNLRLTYRTIVGDGLAIQPGATVNVRCYGVVRLTTRGA